MRERGILFNGAMVRGLLDGTKTQTRRALAGGLDPERLGETMSKAQWARMNRQKPPSFGVVDLCPFGQVGDRLWVREAWARTRVYQAAGQVLIVYREGDSTTDYGGPWKPSIHMPRSACRITLEITGVRVERLGQISDADCWAEGAIDRARPDQFSVHSVLGVDGKAYLSPRGAFHDLWTSTGGTWDAASWTWVIDFRVLGTTTTSKETADGKQ